jgi:pimeloyl-ACP methyl ester carboxylesterase
MHFAVPGAVDRALVSSFTRHHRDRETVAGYLETARRLIPELRDPFALGRIASRVLLVWGDRDRLAFHRAAHQILADVADAQLELMGGFGHCPQV